MRSGRRNDHRRKNVIDRYELEGKLVFSQWGRSPLCRSIQWYWTESNMPSTLARRCYVGKGGRCTRSVRIEDRTTTVPWRTVAASTCGEVMAGLRMLQMKSRLRWRIRVIGRVAAETRGVYLMISSLSRNAWQKGKVSREKGKHDDQAAAIV